MKDCVFCKVISGELPGKFVYKDREIVVFADIAPRAPVHLLVVPRKHISSTREVEDADQMLLGKLFLIVKRVAEEAGISELGYKLIVNNGAASGQLVDHLHIHILGGWREKQVWKV